MIEDDISIKNEQTDDPKIISDISEKVLIGVDMSRNQTQDTNQFATAFLRNSIPESVTQI